MALPQELKDRIFAAANELVAEGTEQPTNEQVRDRLKGGSLSHISPAMREWRESRKAQVSMRLEMPGELKKAVEHSMAAMWVSASKLASVEIENIQKEAALNVRLALDDRDEALAEIGELEKNISTLKGALETIQQELKESASEVQDLRTKNINLIAENARLSATVENQSAQVTDLKQEVASYKDEYKKLQSDLLEIAKKNVKK